MTDCPFCSRDPFHYVDNGLGMEAVAVTCCDLGDQFFRGMRPVPEEVTLQWNEFNDIGSKLVQQAASLAAKDKEIEMLRARVESFEEDRSFRQAQADKIKRLEDQCRDATARAEQAERALAEAVEVLRPFGSAADGPRLCGAELGDDWKPFLHRSYSDVDITNGHLRAARAFVAQHGSDSREVKR